MAADAVLKIKEAEDKASELVKAAMQSSKEIIISAEREGAEKYKAILNQAQIERKEIIAKKAEQASSDCEALIAEGEAERKKILNPDASLFESAVNLVVERIVSLNGNS